MDRSDPPLRFTWPERASSNPSRPQTPPFGRPEVGSTVFVLRSTHKLHSTAAVEDAFGQGAVPDAPVGFAFVVPC